MATILKPSVALRMQKAGKLPAGIKGGHPKCLKCGRLQTEWDTQDPCFWENGSYCFCPACKKWSLHGAVYPACEGHPGGVEIDTTGERKKYPLVRAAAAAG